MSFESTGGGNAGGETGGPFRGRQEGRFSAQPQTPHGDYIPVGVTLNPPRSAGVGMVLKGPAFALGFLVLLSMSPTVSAATNNWCKQHWRKLAPENLICTVHY